MEGGGHVGKGCLLCNWKGRRGGGRIDERGLLAMM